MNEKRARGVVLQKSLRGQNPSTEKGGGGLIRSHDHILVPARPSDQNPAAKKERAGACAARQKKKKISPVERKTSILSSRRGQKNPSRRPWKGLGGGRAPTSGREKPAGLGIPVYRRSFNVQKKDRGVAWRVPKNRGWWRFNRAGFGFPKKNSQGLWAHVQRKRL